MGDQDTPDPPPPVGDAPGCRRRRRRCDSQATPFCWAAQSACDLALRQVLTPPPRVGSGRWRLSSLSTLSAGSRQPPFRCRVCGAAFAMNWLRCRHERSVHQDVSEHICYVCHRSYSRKDSLRDHIRRYHGAEMLPPILPPP